jgi:hypothetical protein
METMAGEYETVAMDILYNESLEASERDGILRW